MVRGVAPRVNRPKSVNTPSIPQPFGHVGLRQSINVATFTPRPLGRGPPQPPAPERPPCSGDPPGGPHPRGGAAGGAGGGGGGPRPAQAADEPPPEHTGRPKGPPRPPRPRHTRTRPTTERPIVYSRSTHFFHDAVQCSLASPRGIFARHAATQLSAVPTYLALLKAAPRENSPGGKNRP